MTSSRRVFLVFLLVLAQAVFVALGLKRRHFTGGRVVTRDKLRGRIRRNDNRLKPALRSCL